MRAVAAAAILALATSVAQAQPAEELAGSWTLSLSAEPQTTCDVSLGADSTDGGDTLHIPFGCYRSFKVRDVTAWTFDTADGAIVFNDRRGRPLYRFKPDEGGFRSDEPGWRLRRRAPDPRAAMTPQQRMSGVWKMTGLGGRALCAFDMTSDAQGRSGELKARTEDCFGEWKGKTWARWTLRGKEMTLYGRGGQPILAFQQADEFTFQRRDLIAEARGRTTEMLFFSRDVD